MIQKVEDVGWIYRSLGVVFLLVLFSPAFEWAATRVGYAEPLENAAVATGAHDAAQVIVPGILPGYSVPGLGPYVGTLLAGLAGIAIALALGVALGRLLAK